MLLRATFSVMLWFLHSVSRRREVHDRLFEYLPCCCPLLICTQLLYWPVCISWPYQMLSRRWLWWCGFGHIPTLCLGLFQRAAYHNVYLWAVRKSLWPWSGWERIWLENCMVLTLPLVLACSPLCAHLWPLSFRSTSSVTTIPAQLVHGLVAGWPGSSMAGLPSWPTSRWPSSSMARLNCLVWCKYFADMNGICDTSFWLVSDL